MDKKTIKAAFTQARNQTTRGGRGASNNVNGWVFSAAWIADRFGWHAYYQLTSPSGTHHALGTGIDSCVNFAHDIIDKHERNAYAKMAGIESIEFSDGTKVEFPLK